MIPVSGAKIDVLQGRTASSLAGKLQVTTAATGDSGMSSRGVSRMIRLGYRASLGDGSFAHFARRPRAGACRADIPAQHDALAQRPDAVLQRQPARPRQRRAFRRHRGAQRAAVAGHLLVADVEDVELHLRPPVHADVRARRSYAFRAVVPPQIGCHTTRRTRECCGSACGRDCAGAGGGPARCRLLWRWPAGPSRARPRSSRPRRRSPRTLRGSRTRRHRRNRSSVCLVDTGVDLNADTTKPYSSATPSSTGGLDDVDMVD